MEEEQVTTTTTEEEEPVEEVKEEEDDTDVVEAVKELDEMFKDRFTESDPAFMAVMEKEDDAPPVIQNFLDLRYQRDKDERSRHGDRHHDRDRRERGDRSRGDHRRDRSRSPHRHSGPKLPNNYWFFYY